MNNDTGTILQDLRDFTVQIRRAQDDAIVGTGIAVSLDGQVITCAHVVQAALGQHPRQANGAAIGVYFPRASGGEAKARRATVAACFPDHDDDVVLLKLDGPAPLAPEQLPKLGSAEASAFHPFRSYGYRRLAKYQVGHAHGDILDAIEAPEGVMLHAEPVQLESKQINQGMSGAAVLDVECNLVVGIVAEVWRAGIDGIDQGTAWGVNARVLSLPPLGVPLQDAPLPKQAAAQPQPEYKDVARQLAHVRPQSQFHAAPEPLAEWVGRADLLDGLTRDYADPPRRVTGLIGFGGEGKSSLARRWVELMESGEWRLANNRQSPLSNLQSPPDGVFWWGFYENKNVDEFFEQALAFISGGLIDPRRMPSSSAKAETIVAMLANGRYLFVLDGLEVLQRPDGDEYGLLTSPDLQKFLELFAAPGHESFCLVTSRAPLLDLLAYTSYTHRDVGPVTPADGRSLLRALGVKGRDADLDQVVRAWDGHALTLSLLGTYLAWRHGGAVGYAAQFDPAEEAAGSAAAPQETQRRYTHVHRVLRRYDEHLTEAERAFLTLFSAFRTPVTLEALARVFRGGGSADFAEPVLSASKDFADEKPGVLDRLLKRKPAGRGGLHARPEEGDHKGSPLRGVLAALGEGEFRALVGRLVGYRLVRHNTDKGTYTTHPLVRGHYLARLTGSGQAAETHAQVKDYYLELAGDTPQYPTLEQLAPLIEVVYHACRAGAYDEARQIQIDRIDQVNRHVLVHQLGAYETQLSIMLQFFPDGDTSQEPQVSKASDKSWILNTVGMCHMSLGRLETAVPFYERGNQMDEELEDWHNASIGYQNLASLNAYLGRLAASAAAAAQALELARRAANKQDEQWSLEWLAWAKHLLGQSDEASEMYQQVEAMQRERQSSTRHLYSLDGIHHAEHLRRAGEAAYARRVTAANLEICQRYRWPDDTSRCHRVLGELDAADGDHPAARDHFAQALAIARSISFRPALIEALLAQGLWTARYSPELTGFANLSALALLREALGYATDGGYRLYEADIRVALAWAHLAAGEPAAARQEATRAQTLSQEMGYHWGQLDAAEILGAL